MARAVEVDVAQTHAAAAAPHVRAVLRGIVHAVHEYVVQPYAALVEQAHIGAEGGGDDVANDDVVYVPVHVLHAVERLRAAGKRGQGDCVVLGKAGDVLDDDVVAARSQIDAVGVLDEYVFVVEVIAHAFGRAVRALAQPEAARAVGQAIGTVGQKVDVADAAVAAGDEIERPPALIAHVQIAHSKAVHIRKEQHAVEADVRQAVLAGRGFGQAVVFAAVQYGAPHALDDDAAVCALGGAAALGAAGGVCEHIAERAVLHAQMAVHEGERKIGRNEYGLFNLVKAGHRDGAQAAFAGFVDQALYRRAAVFDKFHNCAPPVFFICCAHCSRSAGRCQQIRGAFRHKNIPCHERQMRV